MTDRWYAKTGDNKKEQGPFSGEDMRKLIEHGLVKPDTLIREGFDGTWTPVSEIQRSYAKTRNEDEPIRIDTSAKSYARFKKKNSFFDKWSAFWNWQAIKPRPCKQCGELVKVGSSKCAHCQKKDPFPYTFQDNALGCGLALLFCFILGLFVPDSFTSSSRNKNTDDIIPGLAAYDVYGNLTDKGFTKTGPIFHDQFGEMEWICERNNASNETIVEIVGTDHDQITSVTATFLNNSFGNTDSLAGPLLGYVASIPYDRSSPREARAWVMSNIGKRNSTKIFGNVRFELSGTANSRMLRIRPAK